MINSIKTNRIEEVKLHCLLKFLGKDGYIKIKKGTQKEISRLLNINLRTLDIHLKRLIKWKWINRNGNTIYLRSYKYLVNKIGYEKSKRVSARLEDILNFKGFLGGVLFTKYFISVRGGIIQKEKLSGLKMKSPHRNSLNSKKYIPLSSSLISNDEKISLNKVQRLKKMALLCNYIEAKPNYNILTGNWREYWYIKKYYDSNIFSNKEGILKRLPDLIKPQIRLTKRRKVM